MARFLRTDTNSSGGHSRLFNNLVAPAKPLPPLPPPIVVVLAAKPDRSPNGINKRRQAKSGLGEPVVVFTPEGVVYEPIAGYLAKPRDTRPQTISRLSPPRVSAPTAPFVARPPIVHLAPPPRQARKALSGLGAPKVVQPNSSYPQGPMVQLAPSSRGKAKPRLLPVPAAFRPVGASIKHLAYAPTRARANSRLFPPAVTTAVVAVYYGPTVTLAPSRAGKAKPRLLTVPAAFQPFRPAIVHLTYAPTRARAKSHLSAPAVVAPVLARHILESLAPQKRGVPKSILRPPAVVGPILARPIDVTLVRIRPPRTSWQLRRPADLVDRDDLGYVRTHLAYSRRGRPESRLAPPAVVAPVLARAIDVTLVRIRPVRTNYVLRRPADLVDRDDLGFVRVHLAPSFRGEPKSALRPPTVVAPVLARAIVVHLAPSFRGVPKSRLEPPAVVAPVLARPIEVVLARIRPVRTNSVLRRPTDLVDQQDLGFVRVHLARIRPVRTLALVREPVVIDLRPQTYFIDVTLAPSRFPTPKSILREPPKGTPQPAPIYPLFITLAPQRRGKAKPFLRQTIYAARVYAPITVSLAPSRFPQPRSILRKPAVVAPVLARREIIWLAPQRRGIPKSILRKPAVVAPVLAQPIVVTLARIRPVRTQAVLLPPTVVGQFAARAIEVTLAPQRRGVAKPFLREVIYGARVYAPIRVILAPSSRLDRAPHSRLAPPTVIGRFIARPPIVHLAPSRRSKPGFVVTHEPVRRAAFVAAPVRVTLARIKPPKRFYRLSPPAVVGAGIYFRGLDVTLAYSLRGRPMHRLTLTATSIHECYGTVSCGLTFAAEVCGEVTAATVTGITSGATVTGGDSAATVEGASEARGTVSGRDEQREGC
jgi:hypothetical protein